MLAIIREESTSSDVAKEERKLIEAAQNGDQTAFGLLIRKHQRRLFRFIYGLVGSFDVAEDVVQEAFVRAYGALERFKTKYAFYPWLSTIARNLAYNHIAAQEKKHSLEDLQEKGFDPPQPDLGPMEILLDDENQKQFYRALLTMPPTFRAVFALRMFEKMDYSTIASYLKIPPGTVDSRLYRARKFLVDALKDLL